MAKKTSNQNIPKTQNQQWREWAALAQKGDKRAYASLLKDILPFIRNVIIGGLANPDWAEDIAQEVLLSVHKALKTYSPERPFRPWLMSIISYRKADFLRKHYARNRDKQTNLDDPEFTNAHVTEPANAGEYIDIESALNELTAKQRKIFEMIKIKGYTAQEVADELDMSVSAVKVSAHRTQKKLKEELE